MANEPPYSDTAVLVDQTCAQLRLYVRQHSHAADTSDGIALWWLHDAGETLAPAVLERALQRLAAEGLLASRPLPSGRPLWYVVPGNPPG
jgi:hypothetical protein